VEKWGKVAADSRQGSNKTDNEALNNSKTFALTTCGPAEKWRWLWACLSFKYIISELSKRRGYGLVQGSLQYVVKFAGKGQLNSIKSVRQVLIRNPNRFPWDFFLRCHINHKGILTSYKGV